MEVRRIFDLFTHQQQHHANKAALTQRDTIGWESLSTADCLDLTEKMSAALLKLEVEPGDVVVLYVQNSSAYYLLLVQAILQLGAVVAPLCSTAPESELQDLLGASNTKIVLSERPEDVVKLREQLGDYKHLQHVLTFYRSTNTPSFEDLLVVPLAQQLAQMQTLRAAIHEEDPAFLRYSIPYKAYQEYSHKEILQQVQMLQQPLEVASRRTVLSYRCPDDWLELLLLLTYVAVGAEVVFLKANLPLLKILRENKPVACGASRSDVENLRQELTQLSKNAGRRQRWMNIWAIRIGERFPGREKMSFWTWSQLAIAEWWRYRHWRHKTGNRLDGLFITEPLKDSTHNLFAAMGIPVIVQELPVHFQ